MDQLAQRLIEFVSRQDNPLGLLILGLSALVEYVFPPFPGDTITLFGAFLITARGWSFVLVFLAVLAGSGLGALIDFQIGRWFRHREETHATRHPRARAEIDRLVARFQRHGEAYIVINRFLPGVRAFFFVAAGMARMRPGRVLLWALVSAALWNLVIIAVGIALGANFEALRGAFVTYSKVVWLLVGLVILAWLARLLWRWRRPGA